MHSSRPIIGWRPALFACQSGRENSRRERVERHESARARISLIDLSDATKRAVVGAHVGAKRSRGNSTILTLGDALEFIGFATDAPLPRLEEARERGEFRLGPLERQIVPAVDRRPRRRVRPAPARPVRAVTVRMTPCNSKNAIISLQSIY